MEAVTTKIDWAGRSEGADEKFEKGIKKYTYLQEEKYAHKKEQLYLMCMQGFSGKFVQAFFREDVNISSLDLDLVRSVAMLVDETFVMENMYKRELSVDRVKELMIDHLVNVRFYKLPQAEEVLRERDQMEERFQMQMDFLKREQENGKKYFDEMLEKERSLAMLEKELQKTMYEHELENIRIELENVKEKAEMLESRLREKGDELKEVSDMHSEENTRLLSMCEELKQRLAESMEELPESKERHGFWTFISESRRKKDKMLRSDFIKSVLANPDFRPDQLTVILQAIQEDLPLEALQQICIPGLPADNMEILKMYYSTYGRAIKAETSGKEKSE